MYIVLWQVKLLKKCTYVQLGEVFTDYTKIKLFKNLVVVVLGFSVSPTAKVIRRQDLGFKVSSERLEKPGIELTTPGLEGKWLNHYATEASEKSSMIAK